MIITVITSRRWLFNLINSIGYCPSVGPDDFADYIPPIARIPRNGTGTPDHGAWLSRVRGHGDLNGVADVESRLRQPFSTQAYERRDIVGQADVADRKVARLELLIRLQACGRRAARVIELLGWWKARRNGRLPNWQMSNLAE